MDQLISRIILCAGSDLDHHLILVICASLFPGLSSLPVRSNLNPLLKRLLSVISPIILIVSSYLILDRSTRKNLKSLYVFLNGIVSWKMANTIRWINTLSELTNHVQINQSVYKLNLRLEPTIKVPSSRSIQTTTGLNSEGIFRRPPISTTLRIVREAYNRGHPVNPTTVSLSV
ncbi:expressed protein [Phakopsora pachyrhizi]|uniref:Expressed protein n=1 Tax=Phakopsora pachyrhizi TaxID=170000 RepID=A0AAV0AZ61_PHAPC|nr:expressed protein [Phakopsora pachyrhizi]